MIACLGKVLAEIWARRVRRASRGTTGEGLVASSFGEVGLDIAKAGVGGTWRRCRCAGLQTKLPSRDAYVYICVP